MEVRNSNYLCATLFKTISYSCWFMIALSFIYFIKGEITNTNIYLLIGTIIILYILKIFFKYFYSILSKNTFYDIKKNTELDYFKKMDLIKTENLKDFNLEELTKLLLKASYYNTKLYYDITNTIMPCLIGLIIFITTLLNLNILLGVITFLLILAILIIRYNSTVDKDFINENPLLSDFINKFLIIKKLNVFNFFVKKIDENDNVKIKLKNEHETDIKYNFCIALLMIIVLIGICFIIDDSTMQLSYIIFSIISILKLQNMLYDSTYFLKNILNKSKSEYELASYFNDSINRKQNKKWKKIKIKNGVIKYTNVNVNIPDFELIKGEHISIMGASGEGKSTILNILSGVYNLNSGEIFFDGKSSNAIVDALYLSKNTPLFNITLRENLTFNTNITDEELYELIIKMNLENWYNGLEKGFDTIMNMKLSNSVLQKLNIIKALVLEKDIYFFDEPTTDLDIETEKIVSNIFKEHFEEKTVILVTHKPLLTNICKKHYFIKNHTLLESEPLL